MVKCILITLHIGHDIELRLPEDHLITTYVVVCILLLGLQSPEALRTSTIKSTTRIVTYHRDGIFTSASQLTLHC